MNNLLFAVLIIALLYYFYYYLPQQKKSSLPPPNPKPSTQSLSTQTNLSDKQISLLTQQWNQVATWAQELGIDTNQSWNLSLLKNKIKQELETAKKPPSKVVSKSQQTQTDNPDSDLENTLDNLLNSIRDLNQTIEQEENPTTPTQDNLGNANTPLPPSSPSSHKNQRKNKKK